MCHVSEGQLDGYQRRKYLAKIIFTYILGYNVDVGHMEAVNLIASPKYTEKQIVRVKYEKGRKEKDANITPHRRTGLPRHHASYAREF